MIFVKSKMFVGIIVSFSLIIFGVLAYLRPDIIIYAHENKIEVSNPGRTAAFIHKVDIFWFQEGRIIFVKNMPAIHQIVTPGHDRVPLKIPKIPGPSDEKSTLEPSFMKMSIRFHVPWVPVFRYSSDIFFAYDREHKLWTMVENIPARYRSLAGASQGDIHLLSVEFGSAKGD